jgi:hypothetical protein
MPRKPHPADIKNAQIVAAAVRFEIALFLGVGQFAKATATTLDEARAKAEQLRAEHPNGRGALIYAIDADGRSGLVTNQLMKELTMTAKTEQNDTSKPAAKKPAKKAPAKKAAKKAAAKKPAAKKAAKIGKPTNGKPAKAAKALGKRAAIIDAAKAGKMPAAPDFSAATHTRFRPKLEEVVALAKAGDLKGLKAYKYEGFLSSSPKAIMRYRDLCIMALEAKQ